MKKEAYSLTSVITQAAELGIRIVFVPEHDKASMSKQGIHLLSPSRYEMFGAIEDAEKDGFEIIFIHVQFKAEGE